MQCKLKIQNRIYYFFFICTIGQRKKKGYNTKLKIVTDYHVNT